MFTVDTLAGYTYSGNVSMQSPAKVVIPTDFMVANGSSSQRQKGIHVKAEKNKTVAVFGLNHNGDTTDGYLALPCNQLPVMQYEYYAVTYSSSKDYGNPFVLLVGCENSTAITTVVSNLTLNRLETYLIFISGTGARIVSDKPIAFFSGHQCAFVISHCGHLIEQLPPTSTWGTVFLGTTGLSRIPTSAFYRVCAAYDETTITVTCTLADTNPATFTISTGGMYQDLKIGKYSPTNASCVMEASKPVLVMEFQSVLFSDTWKTFMSLLPPMDQYNNHYSLPYFGFYYSNYVAISVLPQYFDKKKIFIDDSIVSTQWIFVKCSNGTVCGYTTTLELQPAGHFVQHIDKDAKIGAIIYGYGTWDAYGCPAGFHIGPFNQGK